jgi:hypothetical protein
MGNLFSLCCDKRNNNSHIYELGPAEEIRGFSASDRASDRASGRASDGAANGNSIMDNDQEEEYSYSDNNRLL